MKSKKNLLILSFLFIHLTAFSQQIGNGLASYISDFSSPLLSGVYNGINATGSTPDNNYSGLQHLLVIRHGNINNNHQLQIASSLESNDRLFFRKLSESSPVSQNLVWHELATRDGNTFNGNQSINGDLKINGALNVSGNNALNFSTFGGGWYMSDTSWIRTSGNKNFYHNTGIMRTDGLFQVGPNGDRLVVDANGKVGIGTTNPEYKLDIFTLSTATEAYSEINLQSDNFGYLIEGGLKQNAGGILKFSLNTAGTKSEKFRIDQNGNVGIGTTSPDQKLTVNGTIHSKEVIVDIAISPDYVFQKYYTGKSELKTDYVMPTLAEIESFTKKNNHLPNVPSAQEIQQNGLSLGEMSNVLLQKIEELTLYAIEQQKKLEEQNEIIAKIAVRLVILEKK